MGLASLENHIMHGKIINVRVLLSEMFFLAALFLVALKTERSMAISPDTSPQQAKPPSDGKLRIICFGAHPDDCEIKIGGTAALWAVQGHLVKFVSLTNGDI